MLRLLLYGESSIVSPRQVQARRPQTSNRRNKTNGSFRLTHAIAIYSLKKMYSICVDAITAMCIISMMECIEYNMYSEKNKKIKT